MSRGQASSSTQIVGVVDTVPPAQRAERKPTRLWLPSQNGWLAVPPQRPHVNLGGLTRSGFAARAAPNEETNSTETENVASSPDLQWRARHPPQPNEGGSRLSHLSTCLERDRDQGVSDMDARGASSFRIAASSSAMSLVAVRTLPARSTRMYVGSKLIRN